MRCPRCHDEYQDGVTRCSECDVALIGDDEPLPPRIDALLGRFHPVVAEAVVALLAHRRIGHEQRVADDGVEILVDRTYRDDLRAELAMRWSDVVGHLPADDMYEVLAAGGSQPGWLDAPRGAWVDRQGRIQVEAADEESERDARRVLGPSILTIGAVLLLFGWYAEGSALAVLAGIALVLLGIFLPR